MWEIGGGRAEIEWEMGPPAARRSGEISVGSHGISRGDHMGAHGRSYGSAWEIIWELMEDHMGAHGRSWPSHLRLDDAVEVVTVGEYRLLVRDAHPVEHVRDGGGAARGVRVRVLGAPLREVGGRSVGGRWEVGWEVGRRAWKVDRRAWKVGVRHGGAWKAVEGRGSSPARGSPRPRAPTRAASLARAPAAAPPRSSTCAKAGGMGL